MGDDLPVDDSQEVEYEFPNLTHLEGTEWHEPFQQLIWEFKTCFRKHLPAQPANLPPMDLEIDPEKAHLLKPHPCRPLSFPLLQELRSKVDELLRLGINVPSTWTYWSQVVMVKQKAQYRKCVDLRTVNHCSQRMNYPIPIDKYTFYQFKGKKCFSVLDNRKGYLQLGLTERAMKWTTYITPPTDYSS
jgi:hypothetical protein